MKEDNQMMQGSSNSGAIFYIKVGLFFMVMSLLSMGITYTLNALSIETKGTVIGDGELSGKDYRGLYQPTFRFVDNKGITHEAPVSSASRGLDFDSGTELMIGYDPDDFSSVRITSWRANWGFPSFFIALSLFFFWGARTLEKQHKKQKSGE